MTALLLWEHISHTINIHAHHIKHKNSLPHSDISTGDNLPDSVKTEHAYMLCNSLSGMPHRTRHPLHYMTHCLMLKTYCRPDPWHKSNRTNTRLLSRHNMRSQMRNKHEPTNRRPLQPVACTSTSTNDDHSKQYNHAMRRANSRTITPWMLNYIMSWLTSMIYHLYRTHKLAWAHPHRNTVSPASRCIKITDTATDITSTGIPIASYVIYRPYRHRAAHLTQSRCNARIHTQREMRRHDKSSSLTARLSSRHYLRVKTQKPAWTNLSSHATCHLQTKKSKWWQIR